MLKEFGRELVFLCASSGVCKLGYQMYAHLLVQDEYGNGIPVAFSIAAGENADEVQRFLKGTASAVHGDFFRKHIMLQAQKVLH